MLVVLQSQAYKACKACKACKAFNACSAFRRAEIFCITRTPNQGSYMRACGVNVSMRKMMSYTDGYMSEPSMKSARIDVGSGGLPDAGLDLGRQGI